MLRKFFPQRFCLVGVRPIIHPQLPPVASRKAAIIASACGTEQDPQGYSRQVQTLSDAGVMVAPSNAHAAEMAIALQREVG
jgi:hypothetical protein